MGLPVALPQEEQAQGEGFATPKIISRLASYPLVGGTWESMTSVYNYGKQSTFSPLIETVEQAVTVVASKSTELAMPILTKHQDAVTSIDDVACTSLDTLQAVFDQKRQEATSAVTRAREAKDVAMARINEVVNDGTSVMTQTATTAITTCGSVADELVDAVKPVITIVSNNQVVQTVTTVGTASLQKLGETKEFAMETVTDTAMGSAQMVDTRVSSISNYALNFAESTLDYVLPSEKTESDETKEEKEEEGNGMVLGAETAKAIQRAYTLTTKARARAYGKAIGDLENLKVRSEETMETMKIHAVNLLDYATNMLETDDEPNAEEEKAKTVTKSLTKLTQVIVSTSTATLNTTMSKLKTYPVLNSVLDAAEGSLKRGVSAVELVLPASVYDRIASFVALQGSDKEEDVTPMSVVPRHLSETHPDPSSDSEDAEPLTINIKKNNAIV